MKLAVDLHIHSALSPCSSDDMTPNNIVNMALIKGLDAIAVTDHNSAENCPSIAKLTSGAGILFIPGMEVETREEVHLICLFPGIREVMKFQDVIYDALPGIANRENIFGRQLVMNEYDEVTAVKSNLLLTAADISVEDVFEIADRLDGLVMPAHIDRDSYSILSNLGSIPCSLGICVVELSKGCNAECFLKDKGLEGKYAYIISSDAHNLGEILERECFIDVREKSVYAVLEALKNLKM